MLSQTLAGGTVFQGMEGRGEVGQHQVTKDAARVEHSVAVSLMAYLVLLQMRAKNIRPGQPWSAFALKHHFAWELSVQHLKRAAQQMARREMKMRLAA
jgi:hypothetical protein